MATLNKFVPIALGVFAAAGLPACGGPATIAGGATANPARSTGGGVIRTQGTGQAVSVSANNRFQEAARAMRAHDDANSGRGDWTPAACNEIADRFQAAAQEQPGGAFAEAWFNRGMAYARCNLTDPARQALQRAIDVSRDGNNCRARSQLGVFQMRANQTADALATFEQAIRQDRNCVEAYTNRAMILRERNQGNDRRDAVNDIRQALARDDRFIPALSQLALIYLAEAGDDPRSQRLMLAGIVCSQAVQVTQQHAAEIPAEVRGYMADVYNTWGLIEIHRGEIIRALGHFQHAYELNPNMFEAWANYGTINLSFRGYRDAQNAFQHALQLRPNDYDSHIGLGIAVRGIGAESVGRALARQNEAQVAENGGNAQRAAQLRAEAQQLLAQGTPLLEQARQEYERARTLDANRPDYYYNVGLLNEGYLNVLAADRIPDLERANQLLNEFISRAGATPRYAPAVERARSHIRNNETAIRDLRAIQQLNSAMQGTQPAGGATPPAGGATPPAGGATPPAGGATPPAGGAATPPGGGATPPAGGAATPPATGATPPAAAGARPAGGGGR